MFLSSEVQLLVGIRRGLRASAIVSLCLRMMRLAGVPQWADRRGLRRSIDYRSEVCAVLCVEIYVEDLYREDR